MKNFEVNFLVLKIDDVEKALSDEQKTQLDDILQTIQEYRKSVGKEYNTFYFVVNSNEPFADEVAKIIIENEARKRNISVIAAASNNGVIGKGGKIPWYLPKDLRRFKELTTGHKVIMGRKTFESIGKLLPNRENIILTRNKDYKVDGARVFNSVKALMDILPCDEEVFVIGGEEVYRYFLPFAKRIYLTLVDEKVDGDTFFPPFDLKQFEVVQQEYVVDNNYHCQFVIFERKEK